MIPLSRKFPYFKESVKFSENLRKHKEILVKLKFERFVKFNWNGKRNLTPECSKNTGVNTCRNLKVLGKSV